MISSSQLMEHIIKPCLHDIMLDSDNLETLLLFTFCAESKAGFHIVQTNRIGIYGMNPFDYYELWETYIKIQPKLTMMISQNFNCPTIPDQDRLAYDLRFATLMAALYYKRVHTQLPNKMYPEDIYGFYSKYWSKLNTKVDKNEALNSYLLYKE